jgi:hypothetical protein
MFNSRIPNVYTGEHQKRNGRIAKQVLLSALLFLFVAGIVSANMQPQVLKINGYTFYLGKYGQAPFNGFAGWTYFYGNEPQKSVYLNLNRINSFSFLNEVCTHELTHIVYSTTNETFVKMMTEWKIYYNQTYPECDKLMSRVLNE